MVQPTQVVAVVHLMMVMLYQVVQVAQAVVVMVAHMTLPQKQQTELMAWVVAVVVLLVI